MLLRVLEGDVVLGQPRLALPVLEQYEPDLAPFDSIRSEENVLQKSDQEDQGRKIWAQEREERRRRFTISSSPERAQERKS